MIVDGNKGSDIYFGMERDPPVSTHNEDRTVLVKFAGPNGRRLPNLGPLHSRLESNADALSPE